MTPADAPTPKSTDRAQGGAGATYAWPHPGWRKMDRPQKLAAICGREDLIWLCEGHGDGEHAQLVRGWSAIVRHYATHAVDYDVPPEALAEAAAIFEDVQGWTFSPNGTASLGFDFESDGLSYTLVTDLGPFAAPGAAGPGVTELRLRAALVRLYRVWGECDELPVELETALAAVEDVALADALSLDAEEAERLAARGTAPEGAGQAAPAAGPGLNRRALLWLQDHLASITAPDGIAHDDVEAHDIAHVVRATLASAAGGGGAGNAKVAPLTKHDVLFGLARLQTTLNDPDADNWTKLQICDQVQALVAILPPVTPGVRS